MQLNQSTRLGPRLALSVLLVLGLLATACGNSEDDTATPDEGTSTTEDGADAPADDEFVSIAGVPGVTDEEIRYAGFGTISNNPLGTCVMECMARGVEAYFAYRNSEGGVHGRRLVLDTPLDDELTANQERALEIVSANEHFGAFSATQVASGWQDITEAGMPLYVWNIHPAEMQDDAIYGNAGVICITCTTRQPVYAASLAGAQKIAILGYGISENSKLSAQTNRASFEMYADAGGYEVVYFNDDLDFGLPNGIAPEVTAMADAGVEMVVSSIDLNGQKTLAQEMARQGIGDVPLYHPNTYDQDFVAEAGDLFVGDYVSVSFRPFEAEAAGSAQDEFFTWMEELGHDVTEVAMVGWIAADAAYQGLVAAGPDFDRASVIEASNTELTEWTAGGLIPPIDWSRQHVAPTPDDRLTNGPAQSCAALLEVTEDATFEVVGDPAAPWICFPNDDLSVVEPESMNFE